MRTKPQSSQRKMSWAGMLITLAVIICCNGGQKAAAQQWSTSGNDISNTNSGNVGIGTSTPVNKLDVIGSSQWTARFKKTSAGNGGILIDSSAGNNPNVALSVDGAYKWFLISNVSNGDALQFWDGAAVNQPRFTLTQAGKVGIGTAAPNYNLEVSTGPTAFFPAINIMASTHSTSERAAIGFGLNDTTTQGWAFGQDRSANGTRDMYLFDVSNSRDLMYWGANGNVGIGTTAPAFKLDVQGGQVNASGGLCIAGDCKTAWSQVGSGVSSVFGRTGAVVQQAGDYTWAQINKTTSSLADITTRSASDLSSGTLPDARFPAALPAVSGANLTNLNASNLANGTVSTARLGSGTANSTTFLRGDNTWAAPSGSQWTTSGTNDISYNSGNVGIGLNIPTAKLDVNGNTNINGNINVTGTGNITASGTIEGGNIKAKYQDVAEWVESSQELSAGTLVVLDHTKSNQVIASSQAYDTRVAGVISERPGIALGEGGDNKVLVATTGRVRLRVDASKCPIQIGDLLVTSDISGVAMKSEAINVGGVQIHRPGTLIGKALEPLQKGMGEILVLLSLQ